MSLIDLFISLVLAVIMVSIGLSLNLRAFTVTFARPRALFTGLLLQMVFLPLLGFAVASLSGLTAPLQVGLVILAACPGGITSNFISYILHGNAALSVSLTLANSLLSLVSIPLIVNAGLFAFMQTAADIVLPLGETMGRILLIVLLPVLAGLLLRRRYPQWAAAIRSRLRWTTLVLLAILFGIKFFASEGNGGSGITLSEVMGILPWSVLVNVLALAAGFLTGKLLSLGRDDQLTLGVEIGIQNTSLAFLIAATLIGNEEMLKPALVYAIFTFYTAVIYGLLLKPAEIGRLRSKLTRWAVNLRT